MRNETCILGNIWPSFIYTCLRANLRLNGFKWDGVISFITTVSEWIQDEMKLFTSFTQRFLFTRQCVMTLTHDLGKFKVIGRKSAKFVSGPYLSYGETSTPQNHMKFGFHPAYNNWIFDLDSNNINTLRLLYRRVLLIMKTWRWSTNCMWMCGSL